MTLIAETTEVNLWITLKTVAVLFKFSALLQKSILKSNMKDERLCSNWMCVLLAVAGRSFLTHLLSAWKGIGKLKTFLLESINKSTQWAIASTNWLHVYLLVWFTVVLLCLCVFVFDCWAPKVIIAKCKKVTFTWTLDPENVFVFEVQSLLKASLKRPF